MITINIDKTDLQYCVMDTKSFIAETIGSGEIEVSESTPDNYKAGINAEDFYGHTLFELDIESEQYNEDTEDYDYTLAPAFKLCNNTWGTACADALLDYLNEHDSLGDTWEEQSFNTYNSPNNLSEEIQWSVVFKTGDDWCQDEVYVVACEHLGGDPRGNYANARIFKVENLVESGFMDIELDYQLLTLDDEHNEEIDENYQSGYQSEAGYHLEDDSTHSFYSEKFECWLVRLNGVTYKVYPSTYAGC